MTAVNRSLLQQLSKTVDRSELDALRARLTDEFSKQPKAQTNSDFYSTKTSLLTTTSPGLRRPVRSNLRKRGSSPMEQKFAKAAVVSSLEPSKQRAIYYRLQGDLPNLHSQDLLNTLYNRDEEGSPDDAQQRPRDFSSKQFENINRSLSCSELSNLKELQLYFCNVESFRSLGTGWKIRSLTIIGSSLTDFSGISGFALIQELYVPFNRISDLSQLSYHQTVKVLDLEGNRLSDIDQIEYLETVEGLEYVDLEDNPLMETADGRQQVEQKLQHKLYPCAPKDIVDEDDLWDFHYLVEDVCEAEPTISKLLEDRRLWTRQVQLSLQQDRPEDQPRTFNQITSIYKESDNEKKELEHLHALHRCKWSLNEQVLGYLNNKLNAENMVNGSRSRSKPKLAEISSKDKLQSLNLKEQPSTNDSEMYTTKMSFRDSIRSQAKKKFLVRKASVRKDGVTLDIASPLTESVRLRPGRVLLKSCLNKL